jgi:hypothetical protein
MLCDSLADIIQTVHAIAKSYWCPFCLRESIAAAYKSMDGGLAQALSSIVFRVFKSCGAHKKLFQQKHCPCGQKWAQCLACRTAGLDPRAGAAFCRACSLRYGVAGSSSSSESARICSCRSPLCAPATPPPPGAAGDEDNGLAADGYLEDLPRH